MSERPHEIGLRFGALAPAFSEQILAQIPDIVELMGEEKWKKNTELWEKYKNSIFTLVFADLITDTERDKVFARFNRSIVRDLKRACNKKARSGGDPA